MSRSKQHHTTADERELTRLRRELEAERRHSARLERRVAELRQELRERDALEGDRPLQHLRTKTSAEGRACDAASRRAVNYRKGSYMRYLLESVMDWLPVRIIAQLVLYLRRLRVVRLVVTLVLAIGAVVLVTVLSAATLPFILLGASCLAMAGWFRSKRMNRIMRRELEGQHIRVLIPPRGACFYRIGKKEKKSMHAGEVSFFWRQAHAMAAEEGVSVVVVSPYPLSRRGLGGHGAYFTARREGENLYMARRHYYFILRRRVLDAVDPGMTVMY